MSKDFWTLLFFFSFKTQIKWVCSWELKIILPLNMVLDRTLPSLSLAEILNKLPGAYSRKYGIDLQTPLYLKI